MKIILNNPVINIYRIQASKDDVPVRDTVDHTNLSRGFVFKEDESMDELKTHNDGVFICTELKELFPPSEWDGSKGKAIGVAIIEGEKRLLVALKGSDKDLVLLDAGKDAGLESYPTVSKARKDTDGRKNTEALLKAGSEAAKFCKEWGEEWHIPTLNDMEMMYSHQDELDEALENAGGEPLYKGWYWTCTRQSENYYFVFDWIDGFRDNLNQLSYYRVRPVSRFLTL